MLPWWAWLLIAIGGYTAFSTLWDVFQRKHTIIRNFPFFGRFRYIAEKLGPPLRQYIVTSDLSERPFTRLQRSWAYRAAKGLSNTVPFGTQVDQEGPGVIKFNPAPFPTPDLHASDEMQPVILGPNRLKPYAVKYIANISGMSFGALSRNAVLALSKGAKLAGGYMSSGEGSVSDYHIAGGGDLFYQIGPGKFGCRNEDGTFNEEKFKAVASRDQVKAVYLKLAQGAKPGKGGVLPREKVTAEISRIRGIKMGEDCHSPNCHAEFNDVPGMMRFLNRVRDLSGGKPAGFKCVLGGDEFIREVARYIAGHDDGPDFIIIDGAEGGTGAAPMSLSDHMGISLQEALVITDNVLREEGARQKVKVIGSGRIVTGASAAIALGLGADLCHIARGFMFSLGCIQALLCNTNHCPTGVATQSRWLTRGLDPESKSVRVSNYMQAIHHDVMMIVRALGLQHPNDITRKHMSMIVEPGRRVALTEIYPTTMKAFHQTRIIRRADLPAA
ncbi:MAG: FMN-binding glutamate synthase family protein [Planctomycetes bacterium]|nr:FMN-binding glutamate synthase family protein [Planctomycetota bacterium]